MSKPRVLMPISIQFSVRYLLRSGILRRAREICQPVVLLAWRDEELESELKREGSEVHRLPHAVWQDGYSRVRSWANACFATRLASPSAAIRERRDALIRTPRQRAMKKAGNVAARILTALPPALDELQRLEREAFWEHTNASEVARFVRALRPDAGFSITPFLHDEEMTMRAAAMLDIPLCGAILSFDNVTTRGWIPISFQKYLLWNRHNAGQLYRGYPEAKRAEVRLVGSPQFDLYYQRGFVWDEGYWRKRLCLPESGPVILYGGGFYTCSPQEPNFLAQLDDAIDAGVLARNTTILFRRHPVDPMERWSAVLQSAKHVVYDEPWPTGDIPGHANVRRQDIQKLASTLCHCLVHVNVASTLAVDGAIFDRPQVGPAYDDGPGRRWDRATLDLYHQEHYLPITESGGLTVARDRLAMLEAIRDGLEDAGRLASGRKRLVQEICTYADGCAGERVFDELAAFLGSPERRLPQDMSCAV